MSLIVIHSNRFVDHLTPPGHPERPERAEVMDVIASRWRTRGGEIVAPRLVTREQLLRVHDGDYVRRVSETKGRATALDPDTYTSPDSYDVALMAAGAAVDAVERVLGGSHQRALALVRPPGHHAERDRAMGFCFFNNVAVAAAHARALGARRVAIVDFDVHHGNGTQHIFESDPSVLYVSTHQYPFYPGTGAATEIGDGEGGGFTVNVPLEVGAVDDDYRIAFEELIVPVLTEFEPDLVLVSAGFDAHEDDPLAGMRLTTPAFSAMTAALRQVAERSAEGRIVAVTEGGYDLHALGTSLDLVVGVLGASEAPEPAWPTSGGADLASARSTRGAEAVASTRAALGRSWRL